MRNFILTDLADKMEFPVVKSGVPLTIHGFNSSRTIITKVVEFHIEVAEKTHLIEAVCIDQINTKFKATGMRHIVSKFTQGGHEIADQNLRHGKESVDNIELILGAESDFILPLTYVSFGNPEKPSVYINTPIGVMFICQAHFGLT